MKVAVIAMGMYHEQYLEDCCEGVVAVKKLTMSDEERAALAKSAATIKGVCVSAGLL